MLLFKEFVLYLFTTRFKIQTFIIELINYLKNALYLLLVTLLAKKAFRK